MHMYRDGMSSSVVEPNHSRVGLSSVSLNRLKQDGWLLNGNQAAEVLRERKGAAGPKKPPYGRV